MNLLKHKRLRTRWKRLGLCIRCGKEKEDNGKYCCDKCIAYSKEYRQKRKSEVVK